MFSFLIILLILFSIITILCCFIIRNLLKKLELYEDWVVNLNKRIQNTYQTMIYLDEKHMFESDDDVGVVFSEIKSTLKDLNDKMGDNYNE